MVHVGKSLNWILVPTFINNVVLLSREPFEKQFFNFIYSHARVLISREQGDKVPVKVKYDSNSTLL